MDQSHRFASPGSGGLQGPSCCAGVSQRQSHGKTYAVLLATRRAGLPKGDNCLQLLDVLRVAPSVLSHPPKSRCNLAHNQSHDPKNLSHQALQPSMQSPDSKCYRCSVSFPTDNCLPEKSMPISPRSTILETISGSQLLYADHRR